LASAGEGADLNLWDVRTGGLRHRLDSRMSDVVALHFSESNQLRSISADGTCAEWNTDTGEIRKQWRYAGANVSCVGFHDGADLVALAEEGGGRIHLCRIDDPKPYASLMNSFGRITQLRFCRTNRYLLSVHS